MKKRGQSAMEFLMTYGWAILVVLIALAALFYLGVFEPKTSPVCEIQPPFACNDVQIDEGGVTFMLENMNVNSISKVNMQVNGQDCNEIWIDDSFTTFINNIRNKKTKIECYGLELNPKDKVTVDLNFLYIANNLEHNITAEGSSIVEIGNEHTGNVILLLHMDGDATDSSPYGYDGTLVGDTNCNAGGKIGQGCYFDGNDDWISLSDSLGSVSHVFNAFSFIVWINFTNAPPSGRVMQWDGTSFYLNVISDDVNFRHADIGDGGSIAYDVGLSTGDWQFFVITWNGTSTGIYLDGELKYTESATGIMTFNPATTYIGAQTSGLYEVEGVMDELRILNGSLTSDEVLTLYNSYN